MFNRKKGFTLTEVIVVIVIIAALALILIPNMLSLMPDDHNIKYKKAFYTIQEIVNDIANECQGLSWNTSDGGYWENASSPDNVLNYCYDNDSSPNKLYLAHEICTRLSTTSECSNSLSGDSATNIQTTNGMTWWFPNRILDTTFSSDATIYVNVNNETLSSPSTTAPNNGTYRILVSKTGKVKTPSSGPEKDYLLKNPTKD